jgi:hypothetical protein
MNRSIETRLKRLEEASAPDEPQPRLHVVFGPTREEANAKIAATKAAGEAAPGDHFIRILSGEPDPDCHMYKNYRWEGSPGRWVRKDGPYIP